MFDFSSPLKFEISGTLEDVDPTIYASYFSNILADDIRYAGKQTDKNGVEHDSWSYTFTAPCSVATTFSLDNIPYAPACKRKNRTTKLRKRQRRTAQRRHNQGRRGKRQ